MESVQIRSFFWSVFRHFPRSEVYCSASLTELGTEGNSVKLQLRNSHPGCPIIKGVLKNSTKCTRKRLCWAATFDEVAGLRPATF